MALIKCPECGKDVSDKADVCIHCGYPIKNEVENQKVYAIKLTRLRGYNATEKLRSENATVDIIEKYLGVPRSEARTQAENLPIIIGDGLERETAQYLVYDLDRWGCTSEIVESESTEFVPIYNDRIRKRMEERPLDGKVHCPKCNGTDIDVVQKGYGLLRGFVGSNKPMNVCKKCGYKWEAYGR